MCYHVWSSSLSSFNCIQTALAVQVERLEMAEGQAALYTEALENLRSTARSSGLQPSAPCMAVHNQPDACTFHAYMQACTLAAYASLGFGACLTA